MASSPAPVVKGVEGEFLNVNINEAVRVAKDAAAEADVVVLGANIARQCLEARLLDEIIVHLAPVLVGGGVRCSNGMGTRCHFGSSPRRRRVRRQCCTTRPPEGARRRAETKDVSASSAVPTKHLASKRAAGLWLLIAYEEPPGSGHDPHQRQPEEDDQDDEPDHLGPAHGHNVLLGLRPFALRER
jgi:hypothetical protein